MRRRDRSLLCAGLLLSGCTVGEPCVRARRCDGHVLTLESCEGAIALERCDARGMRCDPEEGCVGCLPGYARCEGDAVWRCDASGAAALEARCDVARGEGCVGGACVDLCALAAAESTYLGCEHLAITALNSSLPEGFDFTLVLGNPGDQDASVRVLRDGAEVASTTVPARSTATLALPRIDELARSRRSSTLARAGAYRVRADRPIAAYQYNPLEFRRDERCALTGTSADLECFSFSNDASLLLPTHALGARYLADARRAVVGAGSFVAIAAPARARVRVTVTSALAPSADGALAAIAAGDTFEVDLEAGDVLQLVSLDGSLAGTEIDAGAPVLVIAGADCANVPPASPACDHLEEIMPPLSAWGRTVVAAAPRSVDGEPSVLRVTSGADGNVITLSNVAAPIPLSRGERFEIVTADDVLVEGTHPLLVTQYLVGALYFDRAIPGRDASTVGDPAMGLATPVEQLRTSYAFVVPSSFDRNTAAIVAHAGDEVRLDGAPVEAWDAVASSPWRVARVPIEGGPHVLSSTRGAGLTLYGVAPFTSYLLPGGLDVEALQ